MVAIPFLLFDGALFGVVDTRIWGTGLIWIGVRADDLVDGVLHAQGDARDSRQGAMTPGRHAELPMGGPQSAALDAAMPAVFVLIWSTGFVVARLGMPHAPPMRFLAWRFALSVLAFVLWVLSRAAWPQGRRQWLHLAVTGT
jgi:hypothetical protein